jgi:hypothetical protein
MGILECDLSKIWRRSGRSICNSHLPIGDAVPSNNHICADYCQLSTIRVKQNPLQRVTFARGYTCRASYKCRNVAHSRLQVTRRMNVGSLYFSLQVFYGVLLLIFVHRNEDMNRLYLSESIKLFMLQCSKA